MTNEPRAMQEIHEIRAKLYEKTKNMTAKERTAYYRAKAEEMEKKHGVKFNRFPPKPYDAVMRQN